MSKVSDHMTFPVFTIDCHEVLADATELMSQHGVHHLVVLERGRAIGVLSERDVFRLEAKKAIVPEVLEVGQAMSPECFVVPPDAPLAEVVREMAREGYGSALVGSPETVVGIFTVTDALLALAALVSPTDSGESTSARPA